MHAPMTGHFVLALGESYLVHRGKARNRLQELGAIPTVPIRHGNNERYLSTGTAEELGYVLSHTDALKASQLCRQNPDI